MPRFAYSTPENHMTTTDSKYLYLLQVIFTYTKKYVLEINICTALMSSQKFRKQKNVYSVLSLKQFFDKQPTLLILRFLKLISSLVGS